MGSLDEKVKTSIDRLKAFEPPEGYYLAFSGGKDSVVCKALLEMAGCKYDATYRVTSVDPPELVRFIKDKHSDVIREIPRWPDDYKNEKLAGNPITMWNLITEKGYPPSRHVRSCCEKLKESGGDGRIVVTGVRWAESPARRQNQGLVVTMAKSQAEKTLDAGDYKATKYGSVVLTNDNDDARRLVESCYKRHKTTVNPIIDWTDADVWEFIRANSIPYCSLYDEGWPRLGCVGCPLASKAHRTKEFLRWPKYKGAYIFAFDKMLEKRKAQGRAFVIGGMQVPHATGVDVFNWWMEYDILPGQVNLFEDYDE